MANVTRFDRFKRMTYLAPFWDTEDFFRGFMGRPFFSDEAFAPQMKLDVAEDDKGYTVKAEIRPNRST